MIHFEEIEGYGNVGTNLLAFAKTVMKELPCSILLVTTGHSGHSCKPGGEAALKREHAHHFEGCWRTRITSSKLFQWEISHQIPIDLKYRKQLVEMFINLHVSFKIFVAGVYNNKGSPRTTTPWCSPLPTSWRSSTSALGLSSQNSRVWFLQKERVFPVLFLIISTKNRLLRLGQKSDFLHTDTGFASCGHESYLLFRLVGRWWGSCQEWICRFPMRQSFCARSPQLPGFVVIWWVPCFSSHVKCLNPLQNKNSTLDLSSNSRIGTGWVIIHFWSWVFEQFLCPQELVPYCSQEAECNSTMRGLAGKEHVIHWDGVSKKYGILKALGLPILIYTSRLQDFSR